VRRPGLHALVAAPQAAERAKGKRARQAFLTLKDPACNRRKTHSAPRGRSFEPLPYWRRFPGKRGDDACRTHKATQDSQKFGNVHPLYAAQDRLYQKDALSARYSLGLKLLSLSTGLLSGFDIREVVLPHLGVWPNKPLTAHLAVLEGKEAVYIEKAEAPTLIRVNTNAGKGVEAHASAVGKAIAAFLPRVEVEDLLDGYVFKRLTPKRSYQRTGSSKNSSLFDRGDTLPTWRR